MHEEVVNSLKSAIVKVWPNVFFPVLRRKVKESLNYVSVQRRIKEMEKGGDEVCRAVGVCSGEK